MNDRDPLDPYSRGRSNIFHNPGFRFGFFGALAAILINLLLLWINAGDTRGDLLSWLVQLFLYFFFARAAAESQYNSNARWGALEHLQGVQAAGVGAGLVASILVWLYIIMRGIVRDAFGIFIVVEPFSLFCLIIIDVLIALGIGAWAGNTVVRRYREDHNNLNLNL